MACLKGMEAVLIAVIVSAMLCGSTTWAQSSCDNALLSLSPCLTYITGNSSTPGTDCCTAFASLVKTSSACICSVVTGGSSQAAALNIKVNQTQAIALPNRCNVKFSVSQCGSPSPSSNAPSTPSSTPGNDGSTSKSSLTLVISMLFIVVFTMAPSIIF